MSARDDLHARKQRLLTQIAAQRERLHVELAQVQRAAEPRQLMRALVGDSLVGTLGRAVFGDRNERTSDWFAQALKWLRRYRLFTALAGSIVPALRGRRVWRRVLRIAVIGGAAWLGSRVVRKRQQ